MSTAPNFKPHYTVADYELWSGDWELWQGTAVAMTPSPLGRHQFVLVNLVSELRQTLRNTNWIVLAEIDWRIDDSTVVRPDAVVIEGPLPNRHVERRPVLIAEILSESTAEKDRTAKYELYQSLKVPTYMMIEPTQRIVEVFVLGETGQYEKTPLMRDEWTFLGPDRKPISIHTSSFFE